MPLRVAHLLPNMVVGGRERMVADLCRNASAHGIEPHLIFYDPDDEGARLSGGSVPEYAMDRRRTGFGLALRDCLETQRIDVLHAQGHVAAALAASTLNGLPMVTTLHVALGDGWRWLPSIVRGLRISRAVTAVSADLARRYRPLTGRPITVIMPEVDFSRFHPAPRPPENSTFTVGIAARLHPVKRHRDLIEAIRLLNDNGVPCRLRIAGEGPMEADLRRRACGLDVQFDGHVQDMPAWLRQLNAFALVSDHEGTPLALLEARAVGLPCVATSVGGVSELATAGISLVPRRRPASIANAIEQVRRRAPSGRDRSLGWAASSRSAGAKFACIYHQVLKSTLSRSRLVGCSIS